MTSNEAIVNQIQQNIDICANYERLYNQNCGMIASMARRYSRYSGCEYNDLMQEGFIAIIKAAKKYSDISGAEFTHYATKVIKSCMQRYCSSYARAKRISECMLDRIAKYKKFIREYEQVNNGAVPGVKEICSGLELKPYQVRQIETFIFESNCNSIDEIIPGSEDLTIGDIIQDCSDVESTAINRIMKQSSSSVWDYVSLLPENYNTVIRERFICNSTLKDIAKKMNISSERVRQIEAKAINQLRKILIDEI